MADTYVWCILDALAVRIVCQEHKGFGGDGGGVTPVPIPNTEVKPTSADGTWVETPWESRSPPDFARSGEPIGSPLSFNRY